jgi:hypothetical protein
MPIFFFDTHDGGRHPDLEGVDLPDLDIAKHEAMRMAGEMLRDRPEEVWASHGWRICVTDQDHKPLFVIRVSATPGETVKLEVV